MILAGTGHRPQKIFTRDPYSEANARRLFDHVLPILQALEPSAVVSGMALGFDTALAQASLALGIPLTAALPFESQAAKWPRASRLVWQSIIDRAQSVQIVTPGGYAAWKMQKRNEWMVDNSTLLLAYWDGSPGGTSNCIDYADRIRRVTLFLPLLQEA